MKNSKSDEALIPNEPIASASGYTLDRVYAALRGEFDADLLELDEQVVFTDLLAEYLMGPNAEGEAFAAKMCSEGGYVGFDDQGRLVRTMPGGHVEVIEDQHHD
ncbi:hypothetical protein [Rhodanobacter denitrificans]|uniref:hypothetical protein n=1 Tax=Rhodanobacter denitrificans TaxID=666685 RepID=UPI0011C083D1|nr:hypothetical protein [Rhodanobacter denitrificans]